MNTGLWLRAMNAVVVCTATLFSLGCGDDRPSSDPAKTGASGAASAKSAESGSPKSTPSGATGTTTASPAPTPATNTAAAGQYPLGALKPIANDCQKPRVLLTSGPSTLGLEYPWPVSKQLLLAHEQFKVVKGEPVAPGEVRLGTHEYGTSYALVAQCKDAGTCNQLAAMYKAVMRSSNPQTYCGTLGGVSDDPKDSGFDWATDAKGNLPKADDKPAQCARLDACLIAKDQATPGDPFLECQKAPNNFKTECAQKHPCSEVLSCLGK